MRLSKIKIAAVLMALILTGLGLRLAEHKPLWNDELYSLLSSVRNLSYGDIITAKITEGNNTPLFYLSQKAFIDLTGYQPPQEWVAGQWGHNHPYSNLRIRILPVACMSVAIAVIFYFFSYFYSIWTGLYALAVAFSSFMVWAYGFEARPYALWFLLTTLQAVFFLSYLQKDGQQKKLGVALIVVHCLLALTVVFSLIQITAVCFLWWCFGYRRGRAYLGLWLLPVLLISFYYMHAPHFKFRFVEGFMGLIGASFPQDRLLIAGLFGLFWLLMWGAQRRLWPLWGSFKAMTPQEMRLTAAYGAFTLMVLAGCLAVLVLFKLQETSGAEAFQISNRYFICLAPLGIIATTLFSYYLVQAQKGALKAIVLAALLGLLWWRILRTFALVGSLLFS